MRLKLTLTNEVKQCIINDYINKFNNLSILEKKNIITEILKLKLLNIMN